MKPDDAEEFTQSLGQIVAGSWRQIALAKRLGVPSALGLTTDNWVKDRLGGYIRLSVEDRREAVKELTDQGHSNREAAEILGVDEKTVRNDAGAENAAPADKEPSKTAGGNGTGAGKSAPPPQLSPAEKRRLAELEARERIERSTRAFAEAMAHFNPHGHPRGCAQRILREIDLSLWPKINMCDASIETWEACVQTLMELISLRKEKEQ